MICDDGGVPAHLRRLLIALALACSGLVLTGVPAQACTCRDGESVDQQARRADVVFSGVLRSQERRAKEQVYTLDVERIYRGRVADTPVEVASSSSTTCGLGRLEVDRAYVVFATRGEAHLESAKCTGTGRATPALVADVERALGPGNQVPDPPVDEPAPAPEYTPVDDSEPPQFTRLAAPGGAMVLLGLLGLVLFRKRA